MATIESDFKSGVLSIDSPGIKALSVFPNPNNGNFNVKFQTNDTTDLELRVFDLRGRKIYSNSFEARRHFNETINLETAKAGVYLMTVSGGESQQKTKRILIK